ncbi:hypothetical protein LOD99_10019 [Oopsacas minuta]|uniref:Uncharacterized protein n=1 Tax=Oopsacas minuta TaxID=111878 RepID=A0AAV7KJN2_9METZ|nr:hypothetical protein LOD99_10018 [Oopsacas minuta]KAI6661352.1 hypothetical protein LOD99_10019 [Oopsacas minuta]
MDNYLKYILKDEIYEEYMTNSNKIELKNSDIIRERIDHFNKKMYLNIIRKLERDRKVSKKSIECIKIMRYLEKNRLSSKRFNDKKKKEELRYVKEIERLEKDRDELKEEELNLLREIQFYEGYEWRYHYNYFNTLGQIQHYEYY